MQKTNSECCQRIAEVLQTARQKKMDLKHEQNWAWLKGLKFCFIWFFLGKPEYFCTTGVKKDKIESLVACNIVFSQFSIWLCIFFRWSALFKTHAHSYGFHAHTEKLYFLNEDSQTSPDTNLFSWVSRRVSIQLYLHLYIKVKWTKSSCGLKVEK